MCGLKKNVETVLIGGEGGIVDNNKLMGYNKLKIKN